MACECAKRVNLGLKIFNTQICEAVGPSERLQVVVHTHSISDESAVSAMVLAAYCPFCGEAYSDEPQAGGANTGEVPNHVH